MRTAWRQALFSFALLLAVAASPVEAQKRRALLVGIDDYSASRIPRTGTPGRLRWSNLEGATNDVQSMRELLIAKYGFRSGDFKVLTDQEATREAILDAIRRFLIAPASSGDEIVFFYAGHGSQVVNSASDEPDRLDETIVPADSRAGAPDIRDKELRPLFNQILAKGARLTILLDSCHSASGARGLPPRARARVLPLDPRDVKDGRNAGPRPEDRGALVLSAAQDDQVAHEARDAAGTPRGAFSLALLEAMGRSGARAPVEQVFLRAKARLQTAWAFQEPTLAGGDSRREQPFFGGGPDGQTGGRILAAVQSVEADGTILLQGGWAAGLREGNVLELPGGDPAGVRLQITAVKGPASSEARLLPPRRPPSRRKIRPLESGDLFELAGWTVSSEPSLRIWIPDAGSRWEAILQEIREIRSLAQRAGFEWVFDPIEVPPTHTLSWENGAWHLIDPTGGAERLIGGPAPAALLGKLTAAKPPVRLFVHVPAPPELARALPLGAGTPNDAVERTAGPEEADYVLVGRWSGGAVEYAWIHPGSGQDQRPLPLPPRTDWQPLASRSKDAPNTTDPLPRRLADAAILIAKIRDWLTLESPSSLFPYHLALKDSQGRRVEPGAILPAGEAYGLALAACSGDLARPVEPRYVYVFSINSFGASVLLFPPLEQGNVENRFPLLVEGATAFPAEILLGPQPGFQVTEPFGIDTFFLLTTEEPIPNPSVLHFNGVRTRGPKGRTPLEELLSQRGSTSRGNAPLTPVTWSIEWWAFESRPPDGEVSRTAADEILDRYSRSLPRDTAAARRELETALGTFRQIGDAASQAQTLVLLGMVHDRADRHPEAMTSYEEARQALAALDDRFGVAIVLMHMGDSEVKAKNHRAAVGHFQQALSDVETLKKSDAAISSGMLAFFLRFLGIPPELFGGGSDGMESFVNQIRPLLLDLVALDVTLRLGESQLEISDCAGARKSLEQGKERIADVRVSQVGWLVAQILEGQMKTAWARLEKTCGAPATAPPQGLPNDAGMLERLQQEIDEAVQAGDTAAASQLSMQKASLHQVQGDFEAAAASLKSSLSLALKLPDPLPQARAHDALGTHLLLWSRYEGALAHLDQALEIYRRIGSELDQATILTYLGSANTVLGFARTALDQLQEARRLAREHKSSAIEREALYALSETYSMLDAPKQAFETLLEYLELVGSHGSPFDQLKAWTAVSPLLLRLEKVDEAESYARQALKLAEELGAQFPEAAARTSLARVSWLRGRVEDAFPELHRARELHRANGLRSLEAATLALEGVWRHQQGRTEEGLEQYRQAIDLYEKIQGDLRVPDLLSGLNDRSGHHLYSRFIEILATQGKVREAFEASERARARALLHHLGNRIGRVEGGSQELVARAEELRRELRDLENRQAAPGSPLVDHQKLEKARNEHSDVLLKLKRSDPEYADLVQVGTIDLDRLQRQVLPPDTVLVAFFVTAERTFAWTIDRDAIHLIEIEETRSELRARVEELRRFLSPEPAGNLMSPAVLDQEIRERSSDLYRTLIAPLKPHLRHRRLIIAPHDILHYLPFAALWDAEKSRHLLDDYSLAYVPSASVLPHLRAKQTPNQRRALVLGDPVTGSSALPAARGEAKSVAKLLGTTPAVGAGATESLVRKRAGTIDLLHLAAHGVYESGSPIYSRIELAADDASDGHLEVHELMSEVDLRGVNLVVLSACQTALGDRSNGDEIVGLSRAFFYAGSPAVLATLWRIDSEATAALMKAFYRRLKRGAPAAEALRDAQREVRSKKRWRSPYFWGAFSLSGDA